MNVELLHITPLNILVKAIRKCYDSGDKSDSLFLNGEYILGARDKALIQRIIQSDHTSTLEHITVNYDLSGYSRALLQEKSRHRHTSVSEKSTRYCLAQLKNEESFILPIELRSNISDIHYKDSVKKYLVMTGELQVDLASINALENLRKCVIAGIPNDKAKYCLPDALTSECIFSINFRSLRNWLQLRTSLRALWEIRLLSFYMFLSIPDDYKFLLGDIITKEYALEEIRKLEENNFV